MAATTPHAGPGTANPEPGASARPRHVFEVSIRTSPDRLWQALTDGSITRLYFHGNRFEGSLEPGSPYRSVMPNGQLARDGTVLESEPLRRLVLSWHIRYDPALEAEGPSRVTWEIEERGPVCLLRLTHEQLGPEAFARLGGGWPFILSSLKSLLETGEALPADA
jgi:uncharacterized protein YndB with AHSA1/START domain